MCVKVKGTHFLSTRLSFKIYVHAELDKERKEQALEAERVRAQKKAAKMQAAQKKNAEILAESLQRQAEKEKQELERAQRLEEVRQKHKKELEEAAIERAAKVKSIDDAQ